MAEKENTSQLIYFRGIAHYLQVKKPSENYQQWEAPIYLEGEEMVKFQESGLGLKIHEDDDGQWVRFKRNVIEWNGKENSPPQVKIYDSETDEWHDLPDDVLIGNGSEVVLKVLVYDTPRVGKDKRGHRLLSVGVLDLVEYNPLGKDAEYPF